MARTLIAAVGIASLLATSAAAQRRDAMPDRIGLCKITSITSIGMRLAHAPASGSAVEFANGGSQVSYDRIPAIERSRVGDRVNVCLVSIPQGCPPGDTRGRVYKNTNLRTRQTWTLPDSQHSCGGA